MAPSLEHEVDIGQISIAKYSNNPPSPARKKSAGDTGRQNGRHQRRMSSMSHPDLSELKAIDGPTSPSRSHLTRSKTMPRHAMNPLANALELDGLPVDHTKLPKLRRWMLAFVLGECYLKCMFPFVNEFHAQSISTWSWAPQSRAHTHLSGLVLLNPRTC